MANDASIQMDGLALCVRIMKDYFDDAITFDHLYKAMKRCCRNLRWKDSVTGYEANGLKNTYKLRHEILDGRYRISKYQTFIIHEPKQRTIVATRFRDRQYQMALCQNGLYKDITEHLIHDNPACQTGKGTDFTLNRMTAHLRRYYQKHGNEGWVLKCDIRHFFPETSHDVAKRAIIKRVHDKVVAKELFDIIDSFGGEKGIALGSQISQLVELAVLDDLDHFIKEKLRVKHYIRYMDDMVLIHGDKSFLKNCLSEIKSALANDGFELNQKTQIFPLRQGIKMMGWRFCLTENGAVKRFMVSSKSGRQRRKLKHIYEREISGSLPNGTAQQSLESWMANAKRGDTFFTRKKMQTFFQKMKEEYDERKQ